MTRNRAGERATSAFSAVVLGTDAVLAAAPATHVQLTHACLQAGYHFAAPASWGDELLAMESLRISGRRENSPAVHCTCPLVADRLLGVGEDLAPFIISLVAPPVAVARYLRSLGEGRTVHITYVGRCPAATDDAIDARMLPEEFFELLSRRGAVPSAQPEVFDSVIPPDRRRFRSLPGGLPTAEMLWREAGQRRLVELEGDECLTDLAQHLVGGERELIDLAPALGCACAGAGSSSAPRLAVHARGARAEVTASEPPRAASDVVDQDLHIELQRRPRSAVREREVPVPVGGEVTREPSVAAGSDGDRSVTPGAGAGARKRAQAREVPRPEAAAVQGSEGAGRAMLPEQPAAREVEALLRRRASAPDEARAPADAVAATPDANDQPSSREYVGFRRPGARQHSAPPAAQPSALPDERAEPPFPEASLAQNASPDRQRARTAEVLDSRQSQADTRGPQRPEMAAAGVQPSPAPDVATSQATRAARWASLVRDRLGRVEGRLRRTPGLLLALLGFLLFTMGAVFGIAAARAPARSITGPAEGGVPTAAADAELDGAASDTGIVPDARAPESVGAAVDATASRPPASRAPAAGSPPAAARQAITRTISAGQVAPGTTAARATPPADAVPPQVASPAASTRVQLRPDSVLPRDTARAADPGAELAAEREAIRRELEIRRARIDSIARRVDSLRLPPPR